MQAGAPRLAGALAGVALFATANTALIAMMAASRLLFAMARGGDAPPLLARTLARRKTPAAAILLVAVGALLCLPLGGVGLVGSIASLLALVTFASVNAALVRLRFTHPEATRPFRVPLPLGRVPVPAVLGLVVVVLLLTGFEPPVYGIAGAALALAFVVQAIPWKQDLAARRIATMKPSGTRPRREPRSASRPMTVTSIDVVFISGGVTCAADLYRPDGPAGSLPCLVMGHGFSGTKGLARVYAERFAAAGLAVLVFDYRHFGASGGQPRQLVDVGRQREDYHAAVRCARTCPGIDPERIALWGTSFSGGHVIAVAAEDPRIAAVVAQVPLIDARRTGRTTWQRLRRALSRSVLKLFVAAGRDACMRSVGGRPTWPASSGDRARRRSSPIRRLRPIFAELGGEAAGWRNAFAPRFLFGLPRYRPGTAERLQMPLLVCVADHDLEASPSFAAWVAAQAPRGEVRHYPVGHFDVYVEPVRTQMIADQIAFLRAQYCGSRS